jgi:hypothetical protein
MTPLFVFSRQRWSLASQRPRQLMSRLSRHYHVLFVEPPLCGARSARLERIAVTPGLEVLVPQLGAADGRTAGVQALLRQFMQQHGLRDCLAWTSAPEALPLVQALRPRGLVYDCVNQAGAELAAEHAELLATADLVLAAGPALYGAQHGLHPQLHCLPNAVDAKAFALDDGATREPALAQDATALHSGMPQPRFGYFGVIDERVDLRLLARLADARPDAQIVMAGPVLDLDPCSLPSRPNIHWLGAQPYARLPYLLAQWDVCLIPFVQTPRTQFLNPTKTLEYLASGKPVVSTNLPDVVALYGDAVRVAHTAPDFLDACDEMLSESGAKRSDRAINALSAVSTTSWERAADSVQALMQALIKPAKAPALLRVPAPRERLLLRAEQPLMPAGRALDRAEPRRSAAAFAQRPQFAAPETRPMKSDASPRSSRLAPLAACALALTACASPPTPNPQIAVSTAAIDAARSAGATELAPAELDSAKAKLDQARTLAREGEWIKALRLAEAADIDAQVARAKAASERSRRAVAEVDASLQSLREEMNRSAPAARSPQ